MRVEGTSYAGGVGAVRFHVPGFSGLFTYAARYTPELWGCCRNLVLKDLDHMVAFLTQYLVRLKSEGEPSRELLVRIMRHLGAGEESIDAS